MCGAVGGGTGGCGGTGTGTGESGGGSGSGRGGVVGVLLIENVVIGGVSCCWKFVLCLCSDRGRVVLSLWCVGEC